MKIVDFLVLLALFVALAIGAYFLWLNFPTETIDFERYKSNFSNEFPEKSVQFYANMRYETTDISYQFTTQCSDKKRSDFERATERLESLTILRFYKTESQPQITITCSKISPKPEEEGHFVAGEGGPSLIINASRYSVIKTGQIALYRADNCDNPQIATHELLHALGFDHNNNEKSIMYPITGCEQEIDEDIIEEINRIYSQKPFGDLVIEEVEADKSGPYLNFEIIVSNYGLKSITNSTLKVIVEGGVIKAFNLGEIDIGTKKTLTIQNLRIPRSATEITFAVETKEQEIKSDNNSVNIKVVESQ